MEIVQHVPINNDTKGRTVKLTLDTDTGQVGISAPIFWGSKLPEVDLSTLKARINEMEQIKQDSSAS